MLNKTWWALLIRGIIAIIFGTIALANPTVTLTLLIMLFGLYVTVNGALIILFSLFGTGFGEDWWLYLIEGILGVITGIAVFTWPELTGVVLIYIIAIWAIITGIMQIFIYINLYKIFENEYLIGLTGILSLIIGFYLFRFPAGGAVALAWLIGFYAIIFGLLFVVSAFHMRRIQR